ncbi:MAG: alpha/beta fold hydrolase [Planctomycetota bacterium]
MRIMLSTLIVLMTTSLAVGQVAAKREGKQPKTGDDKQVVTFETSDGVTIEADYYPPEVKGKDKAPVAILIHMWPADRSSWKPLVPHLRKAGFAILAYDIRGNGGSTKPADKNLGKRYKDGDSEHFNNAWKDAEAAKEWLAHQDRCDTTRIALVGASIGCSISLDFGSRDEAVKAIVCLSPGTKYFGVDSKAHIKTCGKRAILLMSPEGEYAAVKKLIKASEEHAKGKQYPGGNERHGTHMFSADYGEKVIAKITEFIRDAVEVKHAPSPAPGVAA